MVRRPKHDASQEVLPLEAPLSIGGDYDLGRAKAAAARRWARLGGTPEQIRGFVQRTGGLFVPHNGTENSAVVEIPLVKIKKDEMFAVDRVREKYEDSDIAPRQLNLWTHFARMNARGSLEQKYRGFMSESSANAARIEAALWSFQGEIRREAFTYDPDYRIDPDSHRVRTDILAYNSVLKYLIDLRAFTGLDKELLNKDGHRKWPQLRHKHQYKEYMDETHKNILEPLAEHEFAKLVDEAYQSHFSRSRFWIDVYREHQQYRRQQRRNTSWANESPPLESYQNVPEYYADV